MRTCEWMTLITYPPDSIRRASHGRKSGLQRPISRCSEGLIFQESYCLAIATLPKWMSSLDL